MNNNEQSQSQTGYNPYVNAQLTYPAKCRKDVDQAVRQNSTGSSFEYSPFDRQVDIWFLAVCMGFKRGKRQKLTGKDVHGFNYGLVLNLPSHRVDFLELLALSEDNFDIKSLANSNQPIQIANEYANTGMPIVIELLKGNQENLYNLMRELREEISA